MNDPRCKFWVKGRTSVFPFLSQDRIPAFQLTGHMEWEIITQSWERNSNSIQELAALILKAADGERMETPFPLWSLIFPPLRRKGQLKNSTAKNYLGPKKSWPFILSGNTFFCSVVDFSRRVVHKCWVKIRRVKRSIIVPLGLWWVSLHHVQTVDDRRLM